MLKESKKLLLISFIFATSFFNFAYADSALMPVWNDLLRSGGLFGNLQNGGFFGNNGSRQAIQPNCVQVPEYNPYTGQTTYNENCYPRIVISNSNSYYSQPTYYTQPVYTQPVYYTQPTTYTYYEPVVYTYNYPTPTTVNPYNTISYYTGSNIWYPQNNYGYSDSRMFREYYNGGRGDVDGFYDSPYLCFDGGPNCSGQYDGIDGLVYYPNDERAFITDPYGNYYENVAETDYWY